MRVTVVVCLALLGCALASVASMNMNPDGTMTLSETFDTDAVAVSRFSDDLETTGWTHIWVQTNAANLDADQAYAAGYVEGWLTEERMTQHWVNYMHVFLGNFPAGYIDPRVYTFIQEQYDWAIEQIHNNPEDTFWQQVNLQLQQTEGFTDGYNAHASEEDQKTLLDILLYQAEGDCYDIIPAVMSEKAWVHVLSPLDLRYSETDEAEVAAALKAAEEAEAEAEAEGEATTTPVDPSEAKVTEEGEVKAMQEEEEEEDVVAEDSDIDEID
ncbi:phospholipase B-like protein [Kipferlia bialata]|uniref:Phospholipase B-like n=1 Tax=Kipferlia bialata TaxID=797122 RepID=A0A9K3CTJ5_9EUKA|nr:phospholipase B-like protein [Kipferlia bialata]|eukprot:g3198.t1